MYGSKQVSSLFGLAKQVKGYASHNIYINIYKKIKIKLGTPLV